MSMSKTIFPSLFACALLTACASSPPLATSGSGSMAQTAARPAEAVPKPNPLRTASAVARPPLPPLQALEPPPPDPESNIFFDSGADRIGPVGQRLLQKVAEKLKGKPREDVTLVGHTDDAGSSEFNIALAQKRVEAVAAELQALGVSPRQIRHISYGNEASGPHTCATARCRQNERRVELRLSGND